MAKEIKTNFDVPTQVMFYDCDSEAEIPYLAGIAYGTEIICACCGGIFEISDVIEFTPEDKVPIYEYTHWEDLSDGIIGGEYPQGFSY